jgi:cobalt-zinc-cadmium efflux system protein
MTAAPCTHIDPSRRFATAPVGRLTWVFGLTGVFMVVEALGGWLSGSLALLADAGHMLTDVGALGLTLLTAWIARRPADPRKTYGYLRWEILAALVNGALLFGIAALVVYEALHRIEHPVPIRGGLFLGVAIAGLIVNGVSLSLLHGAHRHHMNTRGAYLHILGDMLGSVGAVLAAGIILLTGWIPADPIISIVLSLLILVGAWRLIRESTDVLLEAVPSHIVLEDVEVRMRSVDGVCAVHDLHVWTVTSGMVAMSGHVVVPELTAHPVVLAGIQAELRQLGIGHATIQLEMGDPCGADGQNSMAAAGAAAGHGGPRHRH